MSQELEGTLTNEINLVGTFGTTGGGTTNYNDLINKPSINNVTLQGNKTGSQLGLVSSTDLATVATSGSYNDLTNKPTIPAAQVNADWNSTSGVSEILNKPTIPTATSDLNNDSGFVTSSDLATVATTGSYTDLINTPTIPAAQVNADWNSTSGVSEILNKPTLATVATSGSYNDLTNTPSIPVNSDFALSGLLDTDITTPSANQVLAYDGSKWGNVNLTSTPTISPSTGVTIGKNSSGRIGNMIFLALRLNVTVSEGAWTTVATVNANAVEEVRDSFLLSATSLLGGTVRVDTSGNIQVLSLSALSSANLEINMAFRCS